jgi:Ni/Fe-hydrogenase 1 B-type cytochrome subunit
MDAYQFRRVYVWELPVRIFHWINAAAIVALVVTGFMIGRPITVPISGEAYASYYFGWVRFVHFAAAFVFFFNYVGRVYWGFVGNQYSTFANYVPFTPRLLRQQGKEVLDVIKVDILQTTVEPHPTVGHNAMAGWSYSALFLAFLFQAVTGFGLYAAMSASWLPRLFAWIVPLMGGDFAVRQWHHLAMWAFVVFAMIHVYIAFYHDYVEGRGVISSIMGGWKYVAKQDRV